MLSGRLAVAGLLWGVSALQNVLPKLLVDAATGNQAKKLTPHKEAVSGVAFTARPAQNARSGSRNSR